MRSKWMGVGLRAALVCATVLASEACGPALAGIGLEVSYVQVAPPPPRYEVITVAPGPDYVWIEGFWGYRANSYFWSPGHWERAPRPRAHWVHGRWRHHDRGWYWVPGYWR